MQLYWDHLFFTQDQPEFPVQTYRLSPSKADLHHRGFSKTFRKGGRYGPHWFDYGTEGLDAEYGPTHEALRAWLLEQGLVRRGPADEIPFQP